MTLTEFIRRHGYHVSVSDVIWVVLCISTEDEASCYIPLSNVLELATEEILVELDELFASGGVVFSDVLRDACFDNIILYVKDDGGVNWGVL